MSAYDWSQVSLDPALRRLGAMIRRRWNVWVGLLDADGRVTPLGDDAVRVDLPICRKLTANAVTLPDAGRSSCADALQGWADEATDSTPSQVGPTRCHAGLSAHLAPVTVGSDDRTVGAVYASGFLSGTRESEANDVRELLVDNDLTEGLPAETFESIPKLGDEARACLNMLLEEMARLAGVALDAQAADEADRGDDGDGRVFEGMVGRDEKMLEMFEDLSTVADTNATVLVQGENGTGKELVARAIHRRSPRSSERFVALNCSAVPDQLVESELFGHKKGAFSGAHRDREGLCREAHEGTLFLDEIGDMKPSMQSKLLRFLQEGKFSPVGSSKMQSVDVRVICATNQALEQLVEAGDFRRDLFFRINVVRLDIPPLRERRDDIPLLIDHFLSRAAKKHRLNRPELTEACRQQLSAHDWPGNVRELENEIERLVIMADPEGTIDTDALSARVSGEPELDTMPSFGDMTLPEATEKLERTMILEELRDTGWNKTRTAENLGVSRRNLIRKVKQFGLEESRDDD